MKPIKVDFEKNEVVMTRAFAAAASDPRTKEYKILQDVLKTYDGIQVRRHTIKKNPSKECYKGLTYEYMKDFIRYREVGAKQEEMLAEFDEMLRISDCHSKGRRYPKIKGWFLDHYEDVEIFGATEEEIKRIKERRAKRAATKQAELKALKAETKDAA